MNSIYLFACLAFLQFVFVTPEKICNVLALTGGGSYGAMQLGILDKMKLEKYDILTGVSIGGVNVGVLSYFNFLQDGYRISDGIQLLKNFYFNIKTTDVYTEKPILDVLYDKSLYNTHFDTLFRKFNFDNLQYPLNETPTPTQLGLYNLKNLTVDMYNLENYDKETQIKILSAGASMPFLFPPTLINDNYYNDPGVFQNNIYTYHDLKHYNCSNYNITFITTITQDISIHDVYKSIYTNNLLTSILSFWTKKNDFNILNINCSDKIVRGKLHFCYANTNETLKYSKFDFDKGAELFELGNKYGECETIDYCH